MSRAALIEAARASDCRVVGISAPAGYGKSTLMSEWALAEDRPVAWVSLDRFDDDPAALLTVLASAYARVTPGHADLVADMSGMGVSVLGRAAPRLASAFRASPVPFVLMLDDLHEVQSPACHDALGVVISGVPPGSQLVVASRSEQPHLPRLRASGDGMEFGLGDLALDALGAEQIFSAAQVSVTPEQAAAVTDRTEGWPAGLYLAALIARDSNGEALAISGDDRYVADYLYARVVGPAPRERSAVPAAHGGARSAVRPAVRRSPRRVGLAGAAPSARGVEPVPDPTRPPAGVVSLPRSVPGVPAG